MKSGPMETSRWWRELRVVLVVLVVLVASCSGGEGAKEPPEEPRQRPDAEPAVALPADSDSFCFDLVATEDLVELGDIVAAAAVAPERSDASSSLERVADVLRAADVPEALDRRVFEDAAGALEHYARAGSHDAAADLATTLTNLGEEVQELCDFPLG